MKSLFFVSILTLTLVSCKSSSHTQCDAYSSLNQETKPVYTQSMAEKLQSEDVKFMKENWTKEQIDQFAKEYVYKTVVFNGDTLK